MCKETSQKGNFSTRTCLAERSVHNRVPEFQSSLIRKCNNNFVSGSSNGESATRAARDVIVAANT